MKTVHARDEYRVRALRSEIGALERLRHPGIVKLLESGLDDGVPWYAMELLGGPSLRDRLRSEPETTHFPQVRAEAHAGMQAAQRLDAASIRELIDVAAQLCEPLAFLHGEGLVHRDLKPENIYFGPDGYPVLIDFGLAMRFGTTARDVLEFGGRAEGTLSYMAPEQLRGELVDARGDLYSLGCILFEIATGRVPFPGGNWAAAPPPALDEVPEPARAVVARLLSEKPGRRFGYARDVAARLGSGRALEHAVRDAPRTREYLYRSRFIGREAVLAELRAELDRVRAGEGRLMCVTAPSGAGKTRLVVELGTLAGLSDFRVVAGECAPQVALGGEVPRWIGPALHPLRPFFRLVADRLRDEPPQRLAQRFGASLSFLTLFEPALGSLLTSPAELPASPTRAQVLEHVAATLLEFAREQALLLVLDDLQWADDLTLGLVSLLANMPLDGVPLAIVGTYRIEDAQGALQLLSNAERCREFRLRQLTVGDVDTLVADMLALTEPPPAWVRLLVEKSGGNPFFVAESLRCAVDEQRLRRDPEGHWVVVPGPDGGSTSELPLSSTLEQLIARRLESLPAAAGALLELSSVFGHEFSSSWLAAASAPAGVELAALDELLLRQVLEQPNPGVFRFSHQKLQEIAHARLPADRRRSLHGIVARVLESAFPSGVEAVAHAAALAVHWELAGELDHALTYLERAGAHALHVGAHADASRHLERLLALQPAPRPGSTSREVRIRRMLADARFGLGDITGSVAHGSRVFELLGRPLPSSDLGWLTFLIRQTGRQALHLARAPALEPIEPTLHDAALTAERLAESHYFRDRSIPMAASVLLAVNLAERGGGEASMSPAYAKLGYLAGLMRAERLGRRYFAVAERLALSAEDRAGLASAHYTHALHHLGFARWTPAREHAMSALGALDGTGDRHQMELAQTMLAHAEFYSGDPRAALDRFSAVRSSARARSNRQHEAWGAYAMARSLVELGDFAQAGSLLEEARRLLARQPDRASLAICEGLQARVHWGQGQAREALAFADATLERLRTTLPTAFSMLSAFTGAVETYLLHWQQQTPALNVRRNAAEICRQLGRFARVFPMAGPAAARCSGWLCRLEGHPRRSRRALDRSLQLATTLGMPLERHASALLLTQG